jgi:hypothetical protein
MGSRFDYCVYLHFLTITVDYNSSHIELILNDFGSDDSLTSHGLICTTSLISLLFRYLSSMNWVWVTLRLTVSQSVCLGAHGQILVTVWQFLFCPWGAPSLTRGWVCVLSESVSSNKSIVSMYSYIHFTYFTWYDTHIQYIQGLCQSGLSTADYALFLVPFATTAV